MDLFIKKFDLKNELINMKIIHVEIPLSKTDIKYTQVLI